MWWWSLAVAFATGDETARAQLQQARRLPPEASLALLEQALVQPDVSESLRVELLIWQGSQLCALGRYREGERATGEAYGMLQQAGGPDELMGRPLMVQASCLQNEERTAEALTTAQQAEALFAVHDPEAVYRVTNLEIVNNTASLLGNAELAVASGLQALELVAGRPDHPARFQAAIAGAWALYLSNRTWEAVVTLETALADPEFTEQTQQLQHAVYGDLATFWTDLGDVEQALAAGDEALARVAGLPSEREHRGTLALNRAVLHQRLRQWPEALNHALEALAHAEELRQQWEVLLLLADLTREMRRREAAKRWLERADVAWMALDDETARAVEPSHRLVAAQVSLLDGRPERALSELRQGLAGPSSGSDLSLRALLANVLLVLGEEAEAATVTDRLFADARARLTAGGRTADAHRRRLLTERYRSILQVWLATRGADADQGAVLTEFLGWRAIAQRQAMHEARAWRVATDPAVREAAADLTTLRRQLAEATWNEPDRARVNRLVAARKRVEANLSAQVPVHAEPPDLDTLCQHLASDAALVVHAATSPAETFAAFVLRSDDCATVRRVDLVAPELEERLDDWVSSLWSPSGDPLYADARGRTLREDLFDPLEEALEGIDTVWIVPDRELARLSWAALPTDDGRYLLEDYTFGYLDTLASPEATTATGAPLWVGDPTSSTVAPPAGTLARCAELSLADVPGTRAEVEGLSTVGTVLLGDAATEEAVEHALAGHPQRVHLATHGFFVGERCGAPPTQLKSVQDSPLTHSGLVLAPTAERDGIWTAEEVAALDLAGTELVVLSACDAGLGEALSAGSPQGLRAAFARAGVAQQILGLWPVPDRDTPKLMDGLYRSLRRKPASEALRSAQLAQLASNRRRYGHGLPGRWGAFVVVGWPPEA